MNSPIKWLPLVVCLLLPILTACDDDDDDQDTSSTEDLNVQVGPRPHFLVNNMDESVLKDQLEACADAPLETSYFSIGHRGAAMQFPEHTKESYEAAARMGAGILECDVTFTADQELVCRHSQCDLHTTTNILATDLASQCSQPFTPAQLDPDTGEVLVPASAQCCTSDITLAEFKTLRGKMDSANPAATTVEAYMAGTADWRTDLYTGASSGTLMTHAESIELFKELGVKMTPELKSPSVEMPFDGFSQEDYAQKMIDEYKSADVPTADVYAQSFNLEDVLYWVNSEPDFGEQAVYLDGRYGDEAFDHTNPNTWAPGMAELADQGVNIIAPPQWMLLASNNGAIVPSVYANAAKEAGLDIIAWTFERSDLRAGGAGQWYYQTIGELMTKAGDKYLALDVLAQDVGIMGLFSDWPGTVTYYANCMQQNPQELPADGFNVQLGPRPHFLVEDMDDGALKDELTACMDNPLVKSDFSIGHRGAAMQFPEHTKESYEAAARMGAGILECDVTFTADQELVCRHSQCDLHTTTNILATDLAAKCSVPPNVVDGELTNAAAIQCCTSDITLAEFQTLRGKMDSANPAATTVEAYMAGTADWRTDLYAGASSGTLMTHAESIELFKELGVKMTPELKSPSVEMPFDGFSQEDYAQKMIDEYKTADVPAADVYAQSFNLEDVLYWVNNEPRFGEQAVYLDDRYNIDGFDPNNSATWEPTMTELAEDGVRIIAPPMWMLLTLDSNNAIIPSAYANEAKAAGLDIIAWTFERSDLRDGGQGDWYYQSIGAAIDKDGDKYEALDVLAQDVGILGMFSDWPATVTYYANCKGL